MDKNTITGFVLIALVIFGFSWWNQPSQAELEEAARQDSIALVKQEQADRAAAEKLLHETQQKTVLAMDSTALFFANRNGQEQNVVLKNDKVKLTLTNHGAYPTSAEILGYNNYKDEPVVLLDKMQSLQLQLSLKNENIDMRDFFFTVAEQTDSSAVLRLGDEAQHIDICYTLHPGTYMTDIIITSTGMDGQFAPNQKNMFVNFLSIVSQQEKGKSFENRYSQLTYKMEEGKVGDLSETRNDEKQPEKPLTWVASKNQFFSSVLIAERGFTDAKLSSAICTEEDFLKLYTAEMQTAFDPKGLQPTRLQLYTGPNDFHLLREHNKLSISQNDELKLERLIYFGWPIMRHINRWFILPLFDFLKGLGLSMGIVLLLLTLIVKAIVYPATRKSYLSSARMRVLKPEVDKINAKYPKQEDALKKQQEMMQLYSQYGVSPMGGCLPMLIQMPIWIALFNFVPNAIALRGESFLWASDLSAYDDLIHWGKDIWLIGDHISIFCLLFSLTNVGNTIISMRQQQNSMMSDEQRQQMKMMQWMMYAMPVIFFFTFNNYSSGLCYYYFLSGLSSILIMWGLRRFTDDNKLLAELRAYKEKHQNDPKKSMGSLAARLEALQKQAEEQRRQQNAKK